MGRSHVMQNALTTVFRQYCVSLTCQWTPEKSTLIHISESVCNNLKFWKSWCHKGHWHLFQVGDDTPSVNKSSPVLFTLYTNGWANTRPITTMLRFLDNTAIHDLLHRDQDASVYQTDQAVYWLMWCSPLHCECEDDWGNTHRSKVHRWPQ